MAAGGEAFSRVEITELIGALANAAVGDGVFASKPFDERDLKKSASLAPFRGTPFLDNATDGRARFARVTLGDKVAVLMLYHEDAAPAQDPPDLLVASGFSLATREKVVKSYMGTVLDLSNAAYRVVLAVEVVPGVFYGEREVVRHLREPSVLPATMGRWDIPQRLDVEVIVKDLGGEKSIGMTWDPIPPEEGSVWFFGAKSHTIFDHRHVPSYVAWAGAVDEAPNTVQFIPHPSMLVSYTEGRLVMYATKVTQTSNKSVEIVARFGPNDLSRANLTLTLYGKNTAQTKKGRVDAKSYRMSHGVWTIVGNSPDVSVAPRDATLSIAEQVDAAAAAVDHYSPDQPPRAPISRPDWDHSIMLYRKAEWDPPDLSPRLKSALVPRDEGFTWFSVTTSVGGKADVRVEEVGSIVRVETGTLPVDQPILGAFERDIMSVGRALHVVWLSGVPLLDPAAIRAVDTVLAAIDAVYTPSIVADPLIRSPHGKATIEKFVSSATRFSDEDMYSDARIAFPQKTRTSNALLIMLVDILCVAPINILRAMNFGQESTGLISFIRARPVQTRTTANDSLRDCTHTLDAVVTLLSQIDPDAFVTHASTRHTPWFSLQDLTRATASLAPARELAGGPAPIYAQARAETSVACRFRDAVDRWSVK